LFCPLLFFFGLSTSNNGLSLFPQVSIDQSVVDLDIPFRLGGFASSTIQLIGIVAVMSEVTWQVLLLVVPMAIVCLWMQVTRQLQA
jgi:hypothetical protein